MMGRREEVSKDDEEITAKRSDGGRLQKKEGAKCTRTCGGASTNEEEGDSK